MHEAVAQALRRLERDGLVTLPADGESRRTTRRWQGALARAALRLLRSGETSDDLRTPIAMALVELYGDRVTEEELFALIAALLPFEEMRPGSQ